MRDCKFTIFFLPFCILGCSKGVDLDAHGGAGGVASGIAGTSRGNAGASGASAAGKSATSGAGTTSANAGSGGARAMGGSTATGMAGRRTMGGQSGRGAAAGTSGAAGTMSTISHDVSACMPCSAAMGFTGSIDPCCTSDGKCGIDLTSLGAAMCAEQNAPGAMTSACPSADFMGFVTIPGCCMPSGQCGLVIQQLAPLGCTSGDLLSGFGITPPAATACTP